MAGTLRSLHGAGPFFKFEELRGGEKLGLEGQGICPGGGPGVCLVTRGTQGRVGVMLCCPSSAPCTGWGTPSPLGLNKPHLPELLQLNSLRSGSQQSLKKPQISCVTRQPSITSREPGKVWLAPPGMWEPLCQQKQLQQGWMCPRGGQVVFAAPASPGHGAVVPKPLRIPAAAAAGAAWALPGLSAPSGASPLAAPGIPELQLFFSLFPFPPFFPPFPAFFFPSPNLRLFIGARRPMNFWCEFIAAGLEGSSPPTAATCSRARSCQGAIGDLLDPPEGPGDERGTQTLSNLALLCHIPLTSEHLSCSCLPLKRRGIFQSR